MIALAEPPKEVAPGILDEPVSASRLNCFHGCRLKFFFRYILKLTKPVGSALFVGKSVHHALQEWSNRRWRGEPCSAEDIRTGFELNWATSQEQEPVEWDDEKEEVAQKEKS